MSVKNVTFLVSNGAYTLTPWEIGKPQGWVRQSPAPVGRGRRTKSDPDLLVMLGVGLKGLKVVVVSVL